MADRPAEEPTTTIETLQSLVVAFVLAMTFRGFVTEGFVIPTGSMAPTLMGEHLHMHSTQTGASYAVDSKGRARAGAAFDPMLGRRYRLANVTPTLSRPRLGDRILVMKCLYPFSEPDRFDVVVFKNPTDPDGDAENYIKRLVGLPDEAVWLADGDVFVAPASEADDLPAYRIRRKPEHIQRAVWQPVHHSDYVPVHPDRLTPPYAPPWQGSAWDTAGRSYRCETAEPTTLVWQNELMPINDWTPYNMFSLAQTRRAGDERHVSDVRVCADLVADAAGLETALELRTRGHLYRFALRDGRAVMSVTPAGDPQQRVEQVVDAPMPQPGRVYRVEFWHADQAMTIFIDGQRVGPPLTYDWTPRQRIELAFDVPFEVWKRRTPRIEPEPASVRWLFSGSPVTLQRVRVDRDLHYRADSLTRQASRNPTRPEFERIVRGGTPAFGTHPDKPAILGPDHFFMLGDNSPASSDSRLWGNPHPYVAEQIDASPFVVHRKLLLGKAWVVYFPAPHPLIENGKSIIPNFGRMRFIR